MELVGHAHGSARPGDPWEDGIIRLGGVEGQRGSLKRWHMARGSI